MTAVKHGLVFSMLALTCTSTSAQVFSDEFNNGETLDNWSRRHLVERSAAQYTLLDTHQTTPGHLTIVPLQTPGWFEEGDAPLLFKMIEGDFSVHARVMTRSAADPQAAPTQAFNSAGLMARNASGSGAAPGLENYIMVNAGRQSNNTGSETKNTVDSQSALILDDGAHFGDLLLCRVGTEFHSFRRLNDDADWVALQSYDRPDMPSALQVGLIVNAYTGPDIQAEFDFVRLLDTPSSNSTCLPTSAVDSDADNIDDRHDNCMNENNPDQRDSDGDGIGNVCDPDFNQDCIVNVIDLGYMRSQFFSSDTDADLDGNGNVNAADLGLLRLRFFGPPGPSGINDACN